jgi:large repetitive protein
MITPAWNQQTGPGESQQLVIQTATQLPSGTHAVLYGGAQLAASGGLGAQTWALATGSSLPAGMSLSSAGAITGTPSTAGSYTFFIRVTDVSGNIGTKMFSLAVL